MKRQDGSVPQINSTTHAHLISNSKSGKGAGGTLADIGAKICNELGVQLISYEINDPAELDKATEKAIAAALKDRGVIIAAGGDGTIRSVAEKVHTTDATFAVIPCGTFNFFARTHRIPEIPEEAFRLALTGEVRPVRLGEINGRTFLINASLGLYAKAIREREQRTSRWGRNRLVVILSSILSLLSEHRLLTVELQTESQLKKFRTPMIFIGNNALQLRDLSMSVAQCMKLDLLAVVMMKKLDKIDVLRLIFRGLFKTIEKEASLQSFCVDSLVIHTQHTVNTVALDGEIFKMTSPLKVRALPKTLNMVLPPKVSQ